MRITGLSLYANNGWPELSTSALAPGLNVFHGPSGSGKTTVADLVTHALYGRRLTSSNDAHPAIVPAGEVVVDNRGRQYRLRRSCDESAGERLTVAALDHSPVDQETVQQLVACLSPLLLRPMFAVSFRESPRLDWLMSTEFSQEFRTALWRLRWAPPTVRAELRPIYARLRGLETKVTALVDKLGTEESRAIAAARLRAKTRNRRASYYLSQLTSGDLLRLRLGGSNDIAHVITQSGESVAVDSLWSTQRDQVYLSLCLALVAALGRKGVRLPLVLDEPFARLDARSSAALTATLDRFCRRGHQVLVFTAQREATDRFSTLEASMHEMRLLGERQAAVATPPTETPAPRIRRRRKSAQMKHREAG
jgi:DNA repair exonuclease SbcCD ATPase subunit